MGSIDHIQFLGIIITFLFTKTLQHIYLCTDKPIMGRADTTVPNDPVDLFIVITILELLIYLIYIYTSISFLGRWQMTGDEARLLHNVQYVFVS